MILITNNLEGQTMEILEILIYAGIAIWALMLTVVIFLDSAFLGGADSD